MNRTNNRSLTELQFLAIGTRSHSKNKGNENGRKHKGKWLWWGPGQDKDD